MRKVIYILSCLIFLHILSAEVSASILHKIKKGETLYKIANHYGVSVSDLKKTNKLTNSRIHPGNKLSIPVKASKNNKKQKKTLNTKKTQNTNVGKADLSTYTTHKVERGENLYRIALKFGTSLKDLKEINKLSGNTIKIGQALLVPVVEHEEELPDATDESADAATEVAKEGGEEGEDNDSGKILAQNDGRSVDPDKEKNWLSIIDIAMEYIGVPYRFGGSSLSGIDCSAYVQTVYRYFSIDLPRTAREQFKAGVRISKKELRIGDLIFFRTYAKYPSHVGIYIGEGKMIHASSRNKQVTISSIDDPYYVRRYIGAVRLSERPTTISTESFKAVTN